MQSAFTIEEVHVLIIISGSTEEHSLLFNFQISQRAIASNMFKKILKPSLRQANKTAKPTPENRKAAEELVERLPIGENFRLAFDRESIQLRDYPYYDTKGVEHCVTLWFHCATERGTFTFQKNPGTLESRDFTFALRESISSEGFLKERFKYMAHLAGETHIQKQRSQATVQFEFSWTDSKTGQKLPKNQLPKHQLPKQPPKQQSPKDHLGGYVEHQVWADAQSQRQAHENSVIKSNAGREHSTEWRTSEGESGIFGDQARWREP